MNTSLSVLVPVYDEEHLIYASLLRLKILNTSPYLDRIEIIVVDDGSKDGSFKAMDKFRAEQTRDGDESRIRWIFLKHEKNRGKGCAVKTALSHSTCDICVIHDADLEYHPKDLLRIVKVFVEEEADVVYGSRFAGGECRRVLLYRHEIGNRFLTFLSNMATNLNLTDMETCYKAVRTPLLKSIPIESNDFRLEPELTIKLAKRKARIFEVPISYSGRTYEEGKKISWRDGFKALLAIVKFAVSNNIYHRDNYGSHILAQLSRARKFNAWMADAIRPYCGNRILEVGSGTGNLTRKLIPRIKYVATDINPLYLQTLKALSTDRPYMQTNYCDVTDISSYPQLEEKYDTVICINVIEHIENDETVLKNIRSVIDRQGTVIVLVPQGAWNFGTLDTVLGHYRRYGMNSLQRLAESSGFDIKTIIEFNRISTPAWFLNGRILKRHTFGTFQIFLLDLLTPIFRRIDRFLPFPGLSLIALLEPKKDSSEKSPQCRD